jgi:hypothetical protein
MESVDSDFDNDAQLNVLLTAHENLKFEYYNDW